MRSFRIKVLYFSGTINQPVVYISKYPYSKRDKMNYLDDMIECEFWEPSSFHLTNFSGGRLARRIPETV